MPAGLDFSAIGAAADGSEVASLAVIIGDASGVLYTYEKGAFRTSDVIRFASATKMITGLAAWSLVEQGDLSLADRVADRIGFWTADPADARSHVTLEQTLAFTTGFNRGPVNAGCVGDALYTLDECVMELYDDGLDTDPGDVFSYGPEHMQIAALFIREATGQQLQTIMREVLFDPLMISNSMGFDPILGGNPRYSGNLLGTADDYAVLLTALLDGRLVADIEEYLKDRTANVAFALRPEALSGTPIDWHYGVGFWKECDTPTYTAACDAANIISSPGAFGFTPWVDFERGYWGIVAMDEDATFFSRPSQRSTELEQEIQALIEAQLDR